MVMSAKSTTIPTLWLHRHEVFEVYEYAAMCPSSQQRRKYIVYQYLKWFFTLISFFTGFGDTTLQHIPLQLVAGDLPQPGLLPLHQPCHQALGLLQPQVHSHAVKPVNSFQEKLLNNKNLKLKNNNLMLYPTKGVKQKNLLYISLIGSVYINIDNVNVQIYSTPVGSWTKNTWLWKKAQSKLSFKGIDPTF